MKEQVYSLNAVESCIMSMTWLQWRLGWELHAPIFYFTRQGDEDWSTHTRTYTHTHLVVYPNVMSTSDTAIFDGEEKDFVMKVAEYARDHGFQSIVVVVPLFPPHEVNKEMCFVVTPTFIHTPT